MLLLLLLCTPFQVPTARHPEISLSQQVHNPINMNYCKSGLYLLSLVPCLSLFGCLRGRLPTTLIWGDGGGWMWDVACTVHLSGFDALSGPGKNRIFRRANFGHGYLTNIVPATEWGRWVVGRWKNIGYRPSYGHSLSRSITYECNWT